MKISIITPSFNQARFIERTIRSVLDQRGDFELEYLVLDGGSTDGTLEILRRFERRLNWTSETDRGQVDAINKGLRRSSGDIVGWLNSDDVLAPDALARAAQVFRTRPEAEWVHGRCRIIDQDDRDIRSWIAAYKHLLARHYSLRLLLLQNFISQMTVFWRRRVIDEIGYLDESLDLAFDYEYWLRLARRSAPVFIDAPQASFRWYDTTKSGGGFYRQRRQDEQAAARHGLGRRGSLLLKLVANRMSACIYLGMGAAGRVRDRFITRRSTGGRSKLVEPMAGRTRRVLVFTGHFYPHVGGVERFSLELWRRMAARGWNVRLVTSNTHGVAESEQVEGIQVQRLPVFKVIRDRLPVLLPSRTLWRSVRELRDWSPDVIVTNTRFFSTSILGVALSQRWNVPCLHIDHGSDHIRVGSRVANRVSEMIDHSVGSWVVRRATRCVGVSGSVARFVEHLGRPGAGVLYNGVDTTAFSPGDAGSRERLGLAADDFVILFVGRLIEDKGVLCLLDAIDRLNGATRAQLVIAGDGPLMPAIRSRTAGRKNVKLLGFVSPQEVGRLMCACDVFVHPSNYPEGLPTSVLEAGAAGIAIVATPMGGTEEIVPTPAHGLIVPPADPLRLAEALSRLERDGELRASLGRTVRAHVQNTFDWERIADAAEAELNALIQSEAGYR